MTSGGIWRRSAGLLAASLALSAPAASVAQEMAPVVNAPAGILEGAWSDDIRVFQGVPFAQPPIGPLRWKAPIAASPWSGVRSAKAPAPACFQGPVQMFGPYTPEFMIDGNMSEDCLYLNVWTPSEPEGELPVLVYIHGGGYGQGSGTIPIYNGAGLAAQGAVVVTINYRLGAFGFLAHPDLTAESGTSGNYGIQDMIAALQWVNANIASFGGDPDKVTIAGQSAGAAAVNALIFAPEAKGLFHRAIAMSGSGTGFPSTSLAEAEVMGLQYEAKLGANSLAAMRAMPPEAIYAASVTPRPAPGAPRTLPAVRFSDILDGTTLVGRGSGAGNNIQSNVPFLTGSLAGEAFMPGEDDITPQEFEEDLRNRFGDMAETFLDLYPHSTAAEAKQSFQTLAHDRAIFNVLSWAQARARHVGQPIYLYYYDHPYPAANGQSFGAFHTSEVPYVMGALGLGERNFTEADEAVSEQLQTHWLAFMNSGSPETGGVEWPRVDAETTTVMGIGDSHGPRPAISSRARFDAFKAFVEAGGEFSFF